MKTIAEYLPEGRSVWLKPGRGDDPCTTAYDLDGGHVGVKGLLIITGYLSEDECELGVDKAPFPSGLSWRSPTEV